MQESIVFLVRVQCRRKFTFAISSADEFLVGFANFETLEINGENNNNNNNNNARLLQLQS